MTPKDVPSLLWRRLGCLHARQACTVNLIHVVVSLMPLAVTISFLEHFLNTSSRFVKNRRICKNRCIGVNLVIKHAERVFGCPHSQAISRGNNEIDHVRTGKTSAGNAHGPATPHRAAPEAACFHQCGVHSQGPGISLQSLMLSSG